MSYELPFPSDKPLFETIRRDYLLRALKWLGDFNDTHSEMFLGAKLGSTWGVAYGLICLFKSRPIYMATKIFPHRFDDKAKKSVKYLVEKATIGSETCHWDGNIWDTAVITRAILWYSMVYPNEVEPRLLDASQKSLRWLGQHVAEWHDLRYTLGLIELSQILRTFIMAYSLEGNGHYKDIDTFLKNNTRDDPINALVSEIMHLGKITSVNVEDRVEDVIAWEDDIFSTGEAIIGLSSYLNSREVPLDQRKEILEMIGSALRYLEVQQNDGRWGVEEETAIALRAYLIGYQSWVNNISPEPHIVFKSIRYLCDPKTVFPDGSIAHEMEPTVYYTLALLEVLKSWYVPDQLCESKPTIELYDYILWNSPSRTTHERLLRTKAETEANILRRINSDLTSEIMTLSKQLGFWQSSTFVILWFTAMLLLLAFSHSVSVSSISIPIGVTITNWEVFLTLVGSWMTLGYTIYRLLIKREEREKN